MFILQKVGLLMIGKKFSVKFNLIDKRPLKVRRGCKNSNGLIKAAIKVFRRVHNIFRNLMIELESNAKFRIK